ncbi:hypothetical protein LOK49_LG08G00727 [Camellia lanceoleosa]|uniref:Uncharacterized protein n=1 Tax=Camellia lanceoleosa TaxID=1840588 RepID=A0ACC0GUD0_9ERIC|nr:hypothetical protein LOK49_LG08G00727 [Camellia lanceoleosa]
MTEDAKERALEKLSINVCGKQLLIFRIDAPRTTVVRISNLYSAEAKKKLFSICRSYGKVKVVVFRHKEIRDVHFMLSEWPNMLKILNRLNGLKVDDCRIIAQPALVFPPEVLRVLWSHPDERQRLETTIWMKTLLYTRLKVMTNMLITDPISHLPSSALGPLWEVTRQKFHGGSISKGSELQIEVAEFSWRNVQLHGSLKVVAENILGSTRMDENGIDWTSRNNTYWKHDVQRFEALKVILHGNAEFEATDVVFQFIAKLEPLITDLEPPFTNLEQLFIDLDPPFVDSLISTRQLFIDLDPPFVDSLISTNFIIALSLSSSS